MALLLLLAALWGASFLFIRVAAPVLGPLPLVAARTAIAGLVLLPLVGEGGRRALAARWPRLLVLGVLNAALPFVLIAFATLTITASLASILNATTPLFTALVARAQLGERMRRGQALGFGVGVAGVAMLVGLGSVAVTGRLLLAVGASLAAAVSYAFGAVYSGRRLPGAPVVVLATGQQLGATAALAVPAALTSGTADLTVAAAGSVLALALGSTAVGYLVYFALLERLGPTPTLTVTYLVPVFGVAWAWMFLGEALTAGALLGAAVVLLGVALVTERLRLPSAPGRWRLDRAR